jgi:hypothetical protein
MTAEARPGVFSSWLILAGLFVICMAAWAGAGVILWLVYA